MLRPDRHPHRHPHPARRRRRDGRQRLGEDSVTVAFLGDGATSEGDTHEAMNLAAVTKAPPCSTCRTTSGPSRCRCTASTPPQSIAARAAGYGMAGIIVDGNDVLACYAVMAEAAARARAGEGPTLIEAITYRMGPHTTSDDPSRYRSAEEVEEWAARDPISRYRTYLERAACDRTRRTARRAPARRGCAPKPGPP